MSLSIDDQFVSRGVLKHRLEFSDRTMTEFLKQHNDIRTIRTPGGDRRYSLSDIERALGLRNA